MIPDPTTEILATNGASCKVRQPIFTELWRIFGKRQSECDYEMDIATALAMQRDDAPCDGNGAAVATFPGDGESNSRRPLIANVRRRWWTELNRKLMRPRPRFLALIQCPQFPDAGISKCLRDFPR